MKNTTETRKQWIKPQLIVVGRGTTEEKVLLGCKTGTVNGPGKYNYCRTHACKLNVTS